MQMLWDSYHTALEGPVVVLIPGVLGRATGLPFRRRGGGIHVPRRPFMKAAGPAVLNRKPRSAITTHLTSPALGREVHTSQREVRPFMRSKTYRPSHFRAESVDRCDSQDKDDVACGYLLGKRGQSLDGLIWRCLRAATIRARCRKGKEEHVEFIEAREDATKAFEPAARRRAVVRRLTYSGDDTLIEVVP